MTHINRPAVTEKLIRAYGLTGPPEIILGNVLNPVTLIDDLSGASPFDSGYPRDAAGRVNVAAEAAEKGECVWQPGANLVCVLTSIIIWNSTAAGTFQLRHMNRTQTAAGQSIETTNKAFLDCRTTDRPGVQIGGKTTGGADGTLITTIRALQNSPLQIPMNVVGENLLGGLIVFNDTANQVMEASFFWTEYLMSEGQ